MCPQVQNIYLTGLEHIHRSDALARLCSQVHGPYFVRLTGHYHYCNIGCCYGYSRWSSGNYILTNGDHMLTSLLVLEQDTFILA